MNNITITLPDNTQKSYPQGVTAAEIAGGIGKRLLEAAIAATVNGKDYDLKRPILADAEVKITVAESKEGLEVLRHSTAHLLAQAIKELYPTAQITIGPVVEEGFYYDIDCSTQLTPEDLVTIENKMREIANRKLDVSRVEFTPEVAIQTFKKLNENYKVELIQGFPQGEAVSAYQQGEFIDLCRGPHVPNTAKLAHFKLTSIAGAYWRGNENNKMLQRIYGTAFATKKDLEEYLHRIEEAKKRDHRKVGPELGLFSFFPIAPAMPFYLPKGTVLLNNLVQLMKDRVQKDGYQEVSCPQLMNVALWKRSGHWDNYKDNMFVIEEEEEASMGLKPMNCPGHATLFGATKHSYRELPLRYAEFTRLHRNERAGVTHGILRTRAFSQDDGHIFLAEQQIEEESKRLIQLILSTYQLFGFDKVDIKLATRPEKYLGTVETWDKAEKKLASALEAAGVSFTYANGEGAFYGPKIEFHIRDSIGRFWQCGTVQLDYAMAERFELEYVDSDGQSKPPVVIHRAILGSMERFMGVLIEHYNGHFPVWLSPLQVLIVNVTQGQADYCEKLQQKMKAAGVRVEWDSRNEKLGYKIREAQLQRVPLMVVIGDKEVSNQTLSVRKTTGEALQDLNWEDFWKFLSPQLEVPGMK